MFKLLREGFRKKVGKYRKHLQRDLLATFSVVTVDLGKACQDEHCEGSEAEESHLDLLPLRQLAADLLGAEDDSASYVSRRVFVDDRLW